MVYHDNNDCNPVETTRGYIILHKFSEIIDILSFICVMVKKLCGLFVFVFIQISSILIVILNNS